MRAAERASDMNARDSSSKRFPFLSITSCTAKGVRKEGMASFTAWRLRARKLKTPKPQEALQEALKQRHDL
eukprot:15439779-Alexandrium_andersonii.AAC.1